MVMEAPSPQCVGQEFVRQYYTLLHEEPGYMHRLVLAYSSDLLTKKFVFANLS